MKAYNVHARLSRCDGFLMLPTALQSQIVEQVQSMLAVPVPCPNGEPWDDNPDGIVPGQERGPRMNPDTGFWEGPEADEEDVLADEAIAAGRTPGDSVPGVSTVALVRAEARSKSPNLAAPAPASEAEKDANK